MNYKKVRKEIENELAIAEEDGSIQRFKDILKKEDIDLFY